MSDRGVYCGEARWPRCPAVAGPEVDGGAWRRQHDAVCGGLFGLHLDTFLGWIATWSSTADTLRVKKRSRS